MSPSLKCFDHKTKRCLTQNCIVISFRKSDTYFNSDQSIVLPQLDNVRSHSWPDSANANTNTPLPASLGFNGNESQTYLPLSSTSPSLRCTCNQIDGWTLFTEFLNENSMSVWYPYLVSCLAQLEFLGFIYPSNLLIGGTDFSLEVLRSAWTRRVLKAPQGFQIEFIGDISFIETSVVNQTQFTPLAEALCKCINELNVRRIRATFDFIVKRLQIEFPNMELPSEKILRNSLKTLVQERKLYYNNEKDCFIATPYNYQFDNSSEDLENLSVRNQPLMTSEEAFTRLHGKTAHYGSEGSSTSKRSWGVQVDIPDNRNKCDSLTSNGNTSTVTHKTHNYLDNNSQTQTNSSLRRSSSLRIETHKTNHSNENKTSTFKRSKSFKLNRGKHEVFNQHESNSDESCKCKIESNRKQSVLSKFLRFANSGNSTKTKSSNMKSANFSSQFPETNSEVIAYSELIKNSVERKSKGTQTIKCGPEDYGAVIIKQASRHALAKNNNRHNNNNDYDCKNRICCCFHYCQLNHCKYSRLNKQSNKSRYGPTIDLPITTQSDCILCNTETNKINSNRHDFTNNNYWSKPNQQFYRQLNGSHKLDNTMKQNERLVNYNSVDKRATSPLYIRSNALRDQSNETPEENMKSYQTSRNLLSPQTSRLNNSTNIIERPKNKSHLINTSFDSQNPIKESSFKFTQNHSSNATQSLESSPTNANNHDFTIDNSVNVKIEIGSSATSRLTKIGDKTDDSVAQTYQNNNKSSASTYIRSNSIIKPPSEQHMESQLTDPLLTSATTVTTTMTLPNVYNNNYNSKTNWVQSPTDAAEIVKSLKLCNEENNTSKLSNKQNNLLSDLRINSIPHLSPIRQKVAKAKAEFFNSTCPQTPMINEVNIENDKIDENAIFHRVIDI